MRNSEKVNMVSVSTMSTNLFSPFNSTFYSFGIKFSCTFTEVERQYILHCAALLLNSYILHCIRNSFASVLIKKTCLYNFDPLKPHFYIVKLGFTGVYIIFLISAKRIDCVYSLEPPRLFWAEIWKNIRVFLSENFQFLEVKFSIYLNRRVFVMVWSFCISVMDSTLSNFFKLTVTDIITLYAGVVCLGSLLTVHPCYSVGDAVHFLFET